jgi:tryptophan synthase alpha subunit
LVDGVIVGSALIQAVSGTPDPAAAAAQFIRELRTGL